MDFYDVIYNHQPGPCHLIENIHGGSEDFALLPSGILLITNGLVYQGMSNAWTEGGKIYSIDLSRCQGREQMPKRVRSLSAFRCQTWPKIPGRTSPLRQPQLVAHAGRHTIRSAWNRRLHRPGHKHFLHFRGEPRRSRRGDD